MDGQESAAPLGDFANSAPDAAAAEAPSSVGQASPEPPKDPLEMPEVASVVPGVLDTSPPASGSAQPRKGPNPAEVVIRSFVEALARLARSHRDAVREAGGIAPLVTLLRSGTPEVQAMTAAVLRDLASDNPANRDAILKAGGLHELVEMVHKDASTLAAGEAAGALRALSNGFPAGCRAIIEARGVEALVAMVAQGEPGSASAVQATGALANLAQADEANCEVILKAGGVKQLVNLLARGHAKGDAAQRRLAPDVKQRLEKSAEEASNAIWQLAAKAPACNTAIRQANAIAPLVETLLRSGLGSTTAQFAAKAVVELVQADESAKMHALDAIVKVSMLEAFDGHGWSLSFPLLRHLLQGAAERLLAKEEEGISATGIQYAIDVGRAVELPAKRLDDAKATWEEAQAKQKREKLSMQAEARRKAKEDEVVQRAAEKRMQDDEAAATAAVVAEAEAATGGVKKTRKERIEAASKGSSGGASAPAATPSKSGGRTSSSSSSGARGSSTATNGAPASARGGDSKSRLDARKNYKPAAAKGSDSHRASSGSESHRAGSGTARSRPSSAKAKGGGKLGSASARTGGNPLATAMGADTVTGLQFIPRAQLLEKIERIAALNKTAPPMPQGVAGGQPGVAPTDAIESWHNRWHQKYSRGAGFEHGFSGKTATGGGARAAAPAAAPGEELGATDASFLSTNATGMSLSTTERRSDG